MPPPASHELSCFAAGHLHNFDPEASDYYKAILQNLFFATLNTPINQRCFSSRRNHTHRDASKYRYADLLRDPEAFLEHLKQVPFVNGGLFDCLDTFAATRAGGARVDCFTDNANDRRKLHVPTKLFFDPEDGIFTLFNRYKFTVEENTPIEQEVALDPELLGQVFENMLGAYNPETQSTARRATGSYYTPRQIVDYMVDESLTARRATGSYYTPRQIVDYMVDESLIAYFGQKVIPYDGDREWFETRLREDLLAYEGQGDIGKPNDHLIDEFEIDAFISAIDDLKIIDPAVGSGAFPMGILNKLVLVLRKLDPQNERWKQRQLSQTEKIKDPDSRESAQNAIEQVFSEANRYNDYGRKLYLIQNCIYGVDIQPIAITIAKLRFFISLIIEQIPNDDPRDNYGIRPLPNLEVKFVAANTLIGLNRSETQLLLETEEIEVNRESITRIRERYFRVNTRQQKLKLIEEEKVCRAELAQALVVVARQWRLRAGSSVLEEAEKIAAWDPYDQNAAADFFDAEWMFGVKNRFDIVIGNPPYVDHRRISSTDKQALKTYFEDFFTNTADISVYFYKRATEYLRDGGILTYICTNKFMRSDYGEKLRRLLTSEMTLQIFLDFGSISLFQATVNTCIILIRKGCASAEDTFRTAVLRANSENSNFRELFEKQGFSMNISQLTHGEWTLERAETLELLERLQRTGTPLGGNALHLGINTGCNAAYIIDTTTREQLIAADVKSKDIIMPLLKGRNFRKWKTEWANLYLILIESSTDRTWPWSDAGNDLRAEEIFAQTYPAIYQYMKRYQEKLSARTSPGKFYWELRTCAYYDAFTGPKIIYPNITASMRAYYDTNGFFVDSTVYCLPTTDLSLLAILNSTLFDWYARYKFANLSDAWTGGSFLCNKANMRHAPIADRTRAQKAELSLLAEHVLADPQGVDVPALEKRIDALVYRLYGLTTGEIALIEQTYRDAGMDV